MTGGTAALFILGLTGCAGPGAAVDGVLDPIFGGAAAVQPTPTPTVDPGSIDGVPVGGPLTDAQAVAIAKDWKGDNVAYVLADGSDVLVVRGQPLPANVKAELGKELKAAALLNYGTSLMDLTKSIPLETGRKPMLITHALRPVWISSMVGNRQEMRWLPINGKTSPGMFLTKDEAIASGKKYIAAQPNAADWEIIVGE